MSYYTQVGASVHRLQHKYLCTYTQLAKLVRHNTKVSGGQKSAQTSYKHTQPNDKCGPKKKKQENCVVWPSLTLCPHIGRMKSAIKITKITCVSWMDIMRAYTIYFYIYANALNVIHTLNWEREKKNIKTNAPICIAKIGAHSRERERERVLWAHIHQTRLVGTLWKCHKDVYRRATVPILRARVFM